MDDMDIEDDFQMLKNQMEIAQKTNIVGGKPKTKLDNKQIGEQGFQSHEYFKQMDLEKKQKSLQSMTSINNIQTPQNT